MGQRNWTAPTNEELNTQIVKAKEEGDKDALVGPKAKSIHFYSNDFYLNLNSGTVIIFPKGLVKELSNVTEKDLKDQLIADSGDSIHWPVLDFDIHTADLIKRVIS